MDYFGVVVFFGIVDHAKLVGNFDGYGGEQKGNYGGNNKRKKGGR
jgi:hypothetical protein